MVQELSPREWDVARLAAEGMTNIEMASELGLALPTVKDYLHSAFLKTGVNNRTSLGVWYVKRAGGDRVTPADRLGSKSGI